MSQSVMTEYLYYFVFECITPRISALWSLYCIVLMLSVYTWWYHHPTYVRRSGVSVPAGSGCHILQSKFLNIMNQPMYMDESTIHINHTHALSFNFTFTYDLAILYFISNFTLPTNILGFGYSTHPWREYPLIKLTGYNGVYKTIITS